MEASKGKGAVRSNTSENFTAALEVVVSTPIYFAHFSGTALESTSSPPPGIRHQFAQPHA